MGTTAKGAPYPTGTDAPDIPADIQALAEWVDDRPGVAPLTYAQINALAGAELWSGRLVYQTDTGTNRPLVGVYQYNGVNWRLPWNMPWGKVVRTVDNTTATFTDAAENVLSAAATAFTAVANRRLRVEFKGWFRNLDSSSKRQCTFKIKDGTALIEDAALVQLPADTIGDFLVAHRVEKTFTAGAHTVNITMQSSNAAGITCLAGNAPLLVNVDDVGPDGTPT